MKKVGSSKNKKKNRRRKEHSKDSSANNSVKSKDGDTVSISCSKMSSILSSSPSRRVKLHEHYDDPIVTKADFDEVDIDDELDPAMKEELDREVEDFARRLNSDWPERVQEILSLGQERRIPLSINGNGSFQGYAGLSRR